MKAPVPYRQIVIASSILAIIAIIWVSQLLMSLPFGGGIKTQMMHRKSVAMQTILEAMIRGDLRRVERAANQLVDYRHTIEHFLSSDEYEKYGEDFRKSVNDVIDAAAQNDQNSAKEATLRLERSCIECHMLMNRRGTQAPVAGSGEATKPVLSPNGSLKQQSLFKAKRGGARCVGESELQESSLTRLESKLQVPSSFWNS